MALAPKAVVRPFATLFDRSEKYKRKSRVDLPSGFFIQPYSVLDNLANILLLKPFLLIIVIGLTTSCKDPQPKQEQMDHSRQPNHLIKETSPYLLQHAYNPVEWHPWGEEALDKAKRENKLLLISIGYAACHWCHVMEHESFEDDTVAQLMNEYFVNIKVDREERPDIDDIYMTACQMASGRGCGWPLNSIALPDGRPVWAGTYFPRQEWIRILKYFNHVQNNEREKLLASAGQLTKGLKSLEKLEPPETPQKLDTDQFNEYAMLATQQMDLTKGGRKGAPKFPMPVTLEFLLQAHFIQGQEMAKKAAIVTLDEMAKGGIYDHVGGGFARYAVDENWLVPHFEKMLYDNGQLLSVYSEAYKLTKKPLYKDRVFETIEFLKRELMSEEFGFYSSLDADSDGEEGKFYVWTEKEIDSIFNGRPSLPLFKSYYNITESGNWEEGKNILHITRPLGDVVSELNVSEDKARSDLETMLKELLTYRENRTRPGLDDKILCSWNGLALKGLVKAYEAFGRPEDLELAVKNAEFIEKAFIKVDHRLDRNYKGGGSRINAFLDDYANVIDPYIALYQITFDIKWLHLAKRLSEYTLEHFYDDSTGLFFYTNDIDPELVTRKKELGDNVIPGSNSVMARNLNFLGHFYYNDAFLAKAEKMLDIMAPEITKSRQPNFYSNWCLLYSEMMAPLYEIAIVGNDAHAYLKEMNERFLPNAIFLGGRDEGELQLLQNKLTEGETVIYVCRDKVCKLPVSDPEKAINQIQ